MLAVDPRFSCDILQTQKFMHVHALEVHTGLKIFD